MSGDLSSRGQEIIERLQRVVTHVEMVTEDLAAKVRTGAANPITRVCPNCTGVGVVDFSRFEACPRCKGLGRVPALAPTPAATCDQCTRKDALNRTLRGDIVEQRKEVNRLEALCREKSGQADAHEKSAEQLLRKYQSAWADFCKSQERVRRLEAALLTVQSIPTHTWSTTIPWAIPSGALLLSRIRSTVPGRVDEWGKPFVVDLRDMQAKLEFSPSQEWCVVTIADAAATK